MRCRKSATTVIREAEHLGYCLPINLPPKTIREQYNHLYQSLWNALPAHPLQPVLAEEVEEVAKSLNTSPVSVFPKLDVDLPPEFVAPHLLELSPNVTLVIHHGLEMVDYEEDDLELDEDDMRFDEEGRFLSAEKILVTDNTTEDDMRKVATFIKAHFSPSTP